MPIHLAEMPCVKHRRPCHLQPYCLLLLDFRLAIKWLQQRNLNRQSQKDLSRLARSLVSDKEQHLSAWVCGHLQQCVRSLFLAANAQAPWSENLVLFWKQSFLNFEKGPHSARVDLCLAGGCCGCCNSINVCQASRTGSFTELIMASPSFWNPDSLLFVLDFALPQMLSTQPFLRFTGLKTFDEDCH